MYSCIQFASLKRLAHQEKQLNIDDVLLGIQREIGKEGKIFKRLYL